jgi:hypothetical protein
MMTEEAVTFEPQLYDDLRAKLQQSGAEEAIRELCESLRSAGDYAKLFYALLLKDRVAIGVTPIPTASANEMTTDQQEKYEDAIRSACRTVGGLFLDAGNIGAAFGYFRMIGELEPVRAAIEQCQPGEEDDVQPIIDIAFHQGVHPHKGFDLLLDRYGICNAITTISNYDPGQNQEPRQYAIRRLVRSLHEQLVERLRTAIEQQQGFAPSGSTIHQLIEGRDWLFADDMYFTDTSHLSSIVQMSVELDSREELLLARELCAYGRKLSPTLQYAGSPPFENLYEDVDVFLSILLGENVEAGIEAFRAKISADPDGPDMFAAEVLVRLLVRLNRLDDALAIARQHLATADDRQLSCPGVFELAQRTKNFRALAETARERHDPVHYLAGLIAAEK